MYAADHYRAARKLLDQAREYVTPDGLLPPLALGVLAEAQVHATLAQVGITVENLASAEDRDRWRQVFTA
jgi:hypothetical protein